MRPSQTGHIRRTALSLSQASLWLFVVMMMQKKWKFQVLPISSTLRAAVNSTIRKAINSTHAQLETYLA